MKLYSLVNENNEYLHFISHKWCEKDSINSNHVTDEWEYVKYMAKRFNACVKEYELKEVNSYKVGENEV